MTTKQTRTEKFQAKNARRKAEKAAMKPAEWRAERAFRRGLVPATKGDKPFWAVNGAFGKLGRSED